MPKQVLSLCLPIQATLLLKLETRTITGARNHGRLENALRPVKVSSYTLDPKFSVGPDNSEGVGTSKCNTAICPQLWKECGR